MLLELKNLTLRYGKALAAENISLKIQTGSVVTIVGANGSGKSTLLKAISGLIRPVSGEIQFENTRINGMAPHHIVGLGVVHVPEGRRLFPHLTVLNNLKLGASLRKDKDRSKKDLNLIFERFPILEKRRNQTAGTMSGGEQQMLAIARGLMAAPKLLMLDEPSLGLAPKIVSQLAPVIKNINESGVSVLIVEQNIELALDVAETAYALKAGRIVFSGESKTLKNDDMLRKAYLGMGEK